MINTSSPEPMMTEIERQRAHRDDAGQRWVALTRFLFYAIMLAALTGIGFAQTNGGPVRRISLQECFNLALSNNLSLKFERINPLIAEESLNIDRANYYDPTFTFSGNYTHDEPDLRGEDFTTS